MRTLALLVLAASVASGGGCAFRRALREDTTDVVAVKDSAARHAYYRAAANVMSREGYGLLHAAEPDGFGVYHELLRPEPGKDACDDVRLDASYETGDDRATFAFQPCAVEKEGALFVENGLEALQAAFNLDGAFNNVTLRPARGAVEAEHPRTPAISAVPSSLPKSTTRTSRPSLIQLAVLVDQAVTSGGMESDPAGLPVVAPVAPASPIIEGDAPSTAAKASYREFYDDVTRRLERSGVGEVSFFLNYGYIGLGKGDEARFEVPDGTFNPSSVRLVYELIGATNLRGQQVLDVGCGRGGTVALLAERFEAKATGVDLSPEAIAFCRRIHRSAGNRFEVGDAEHLPFASSPCGPWATPWQLKHVSIGGE